MSVLRKLILQIPIHLLLIITINSLSQHLARLHSLGDIVIEAVFVPSWKIWLGRAATSSALYIMHIPRIWNIITQTYIFDTYARNPKNPKLLINLTHIIFQFIQNLFLIARVESQLRLIHFDAHVLSFGTLLNITVIVVPLGILYEIETIFTFLIEQLLQFLFEVLYSLVLELFADIMFFNLIGVVLYNLKLFRNVHFLLLNLHLRHQFVILKIDNLLLQFINL